MGQLKVKQLVSPEEKALYTHYLLKDLKALEIMLNKNLIEKEPIRIGAEQEFCIVTEDFSPSKKAIEILDVIDDEHFTTEIGKYDLEINSDPLELKDNCFSELYHQFKTLLEKAQKAASTLDTKVLLTGILPTLRHKHIKENWMTPKPRYGMLNKALKDSRSQDFNIHIKGVDELRLFHNSVMLEACNTSFQTHLQINPDEFVEKYNWSQTIAAPVMAVCANSPILFGRELWAETRIAVFTQSIDTRTSSLVFDEKQSRVSFGDQWEEGTVTDIFRDHVSRFRSLLTSDGLEDSLDLLKNGEIPKLRALQLHNGTVYKWNRVCYGVGGGKPHLRIECRYIPSGPTLKDEIANMVFWVGLMHGQTEAYKKMPEKMEFKDVKNNFFKAARYGMETKFKWMGKLVSVSDLILKKLLPIAQKGLEKVNINSNDIDTYLSIIENRVKSKNGAQWMVESYRNLQKTKTGFEARQELTAFMHKKQFSDDTIDKWPEPNNHKFNCTDYEPIVKHRMQTKLFVVHESDSLELVSHIMKWKKIHHLPVVNNKKELKGLVSWTDLIKLGNTDLKQNVINIMQTELITISQEKSLEKAKRIMKEAQINCLPVVYNKRLLGILTTNDF
ncbi:MAG: CBS domain-containing protein [Winogradskyella sp.]|uniref:glutamate-cysteine ligase family protein n=1 Tax=Winogradskyella sp. TaxID=1883156 RepID=UPI0017BFA196|nr:glutamate-cysteine ligase family protein [Winogradskyella sp.]MBT8245884.1 CBS domain-containing protein [Winogradskyella sp.]NNK23810.1 CBS domain-containing protein [Winogradskyella sp.]